MKFNFSDESLKNYVKIMCVKLFFIVLFQVTITVSRPSEYFYNINKITLMKNKFNLNVFGNYVRFGMIQCVKQCLKNGQCGAINYHRNSLTCELVSKDTDDSEMISSEGWIFINKTDMEQTYTYETQCSGNSDLLITTNTGNSCFSNVLSNNIGNCVQTSPAAILDEKGWRCSTGYTNRSCKCIKDCKSLNEVLQGHRLSMDSTFTISPDGVEKFRVACDMTNGGWTIIQRRTFGNSLTVDFHKTYEEYKHTFGDLDGDHWIGLENIRKLILLQSSDLRLDIVNTDNQLGNITFHEFSVGDESQRYTLSIRLGFEASGAASDVSAKTVVRKSGSPFSAWDDDNDSGPSNCAATHGAYWHEQCCKLCDLNSNNRATILKQDNSDLEIDRTTLKVRRPN